MEKYRIIYTVFGSRQEVHSFYIISHPKEILKNISNKLSSLTNISPNYFHLYLKNHQYNGWIRFKTPSQLDRHQRLIEVLIRMLEPYHLYPLKLLELENESINKIKHIDLQFFFSNPLYNPKYPLSQLVNIEYERELKSIIQKLESINSKICIRVKNATIENMFEDISIHSTIMHIACHGAYDENKKEHYLCFEDSDKIGTKVNLYSKVLQYKLNEARDKSLKLVFISACHSEFIGELFLKCGVPSVIAVNSATQISDQSAIIFAVSFYSNIFSGKSIKAAFDEAIKCNQNNVHKYRLCCCSHSHKPTCKLSKYSIDKMHELHCLACNCNLRNDVRYHYIGCKAAQEYLTNFKIDIKSEDNALIVCCCHPELPHNEYHKFKLLGNGDNILFPYSTSGSVSVTNGKNSNIYKVNAYINGLVGRNDVVYYAVNQLTSKTRIINIFGQVGVGKKTVARSIARYLEERWLLPMGTLFASISPSELINVQLISLLDNPEINTIDKVYSFLKNEKILLIFDNCQDINSMDELKEFCNHLLYATLYLKIILISTSHLNFISVIHSINIDPLKPRHLATIIRNECANELKMMECTDSYLQKYTLELSKANSMNQLFEKVIPNVKITRQLSDPKAAIMLRKSQIQAIDALNEYPDITLFISFVYGLEENDFKSFLSFLNMNNKATNNIMELLDYDVFERFGYKPFNLFKVKQMFTIPKGLSIKQIMEIVTTNEPLLLLSVEFGSILATHICYMLRELGYYETIFDFNFAIQNDIWEVYQKANIYLDSDTPISNKVCFYVKSLEQMLDLSFIIEYIKSKSKIADDMTNIAIAYLTIIDIYESEFSIEYKHIERVKPLLECLLRLNMHLLSGKLMLSISSCLLKIYKKMPDYSKNRQSILEEAKERSKKCHRSIKESIKQNKDRGPQLWENEVILLMNLIENEYHYDSNNILQTVSSITSQFSKLRALLIFAFLKREKINKSGLLFDLESNQKCLEPKKYGIYITLMAILAILYSEKNVEEQDIYKSRQLISNIIHIKQNIKRKMLIKIIDPLINIAEHNIYMSEAIYFNHLICQPLINERGFPIELINIFTHQAQLHDDLLNKHKLIDYKSSLFTADNLNSINYEQSKIIHISSNCYNGEGIPLCNANQEYTFVNTELYSCNKIYLVFLEYSSSLQSIKYFQGITDNIIAFNSLPLYFEKELFSFSKEFYSKLFDGNGIQASAAIAVEKVPKLQNQFHIYGDEPFLFTILDGSMNEVESPIYALVDHIKQFSANNIINTTAFGNVLSPIKQRFSETTLMSKILHMAFHNLRNHKSIIVHLRLDNTCYSFILLLSHYVLGSGLANDVILIDMLLGSTSKHIEAASEGSLVILIGANGGLKEIAKYNGLHLFINPIIDVIADFDINAVEIKLDSSCDDISVFDFF